MKREVGFSLEFETLKGLAQTKCQRDIHFQSTHIAVNISEPSSEHFFKVICISKSQTNIIRDILLCIVSAYSHTCILIIHELEMFLSKFK